jgi:hypothetical protein
MRFTLIPENLGPLNLLKDLQRVQSLDERCRGFVDTRYVVMRVCVGIIELEMKSGINVHGILTFKVCPLDFISTNDVNQFSRYGFCIHLYHLKKKHERR